MTHIQQKGRIWLKALVALVVFLVILAGGVWVWSGSNGSLAQGIVLAQRFLAPGQSLSASDVQGSLRHGGHIGSLHWQQEGLSAELNNVDLKWQLSALFGHKLLVDQLGIDELRINQIAPERSETQNEAHEQTGGAPERAAPPEKIVLPVHVDLQELHIGRVMLNGDVVASDIALAYQFDGKQHQTDVSSLRVADGSYTGHAVLRANNPLLDAQFEGVLVTRLPQVQQDVTLDIDTSVQGLLSELSVRANAQVGTQNGARDHANNPKVNLTATVMPWAALMVPQADLALQAFNAQAFWPQAPQTLLSGTVKVQTHGEPATQQAAITADLANAVTGALDQSKLPVSALRANVNINGHTASVTQLHAVIGQGAVDVTGNYLLPATGRAGAGAWQANARLTHIDPRLLYSQLARDSVSGTIVAKVEQAAPQTIHFNVNVNAANAANFAQFRVRQVTAQGYLVSDDHVKLDSLMVQSVDARVDGSATYGLHTGAVSGPLKLVAPGLEADVTLNSFAAQSGSARVSLDVQVADRASNWLRNQPVRLGELVNFLEKAAQYTENIANYTQAIPIVIEGGWENHRVRLELDINAVVAKIIEDQARRRLLPRTGTEHGGTLREQAEREAVNRLGEGLLNRLRR